MTQTLLTNAHIVGPDRDFTGSVVIEDGTITEVLPRNVAGGLDMNGSFLIPGVIDIHSDYLERELAPRPTAKIPLELALNVMDLRAISSGLTTVATAARIAQEQEGREARSEGGRFGGRNDALKLARRFEELAPEMRIHHVIHLRWNTNFEPDDDLFEEIASRIASGPVSYKITAQLAAAGDTVDDATIHWPEDRPVAELGTLTLTAPVADDATEQKQIIFDPIPRVDGIEPSDDPLLELRAAVYLISGRRRRKA